MPFPYTQEMQPHPLAPEPTIYDEHEHPLLLSPVSLSNDHSAQSCKSSYMFDFAPPSIESFTTVRRSHQTRPKPSHAFDALPWISAMDYFPEQTDSWDIADLSQLPPPPPQPSAQPRNTYAKPGPIRTVRSALRLRTAKVEKQDTENLVAHRAARRVNSTISLRDASLRALRTSCNPLNSTRARTHRPEFSFAATVCDSCPSEPYPSSRPSVQTPPPAPRPTAPPCLSARPKAVSRFPPPSYRPRTCHDSHRL